MPAVVQSGHFMARRALRSRSIVILRSGYAATESLATKSCGAHDAAPKTGRSAGSPPLFVEMPANATRTEGPCTGTNDVHMHVILRRPARCGNLQTGAESCTPQEPLAIVHDHAESSSCHASVAFSMSQQAPEEAPPVMPVSQVGSSSRITGRDSSLVAPYLQHRTRRRRTAGQLEQREPKCTLDPHQLAQARSI